MPNMNANSMFIMSNDEYYQITIFCLPTYWFISAKLIKIELSKSKKEVSSNLFKTVFKIYNMNLDVLQFEDCSKPCDILVMRLLGIFSTQKSNKITRQGIT